MKGNVLYARAVTLSKGASSPRHFGAFLLFVATLVSAISAFGIQEASADECLAREGPKSMINDEDRSTYERKLFVTPDEVARYMFLTNRYDDGDRSAAVYRAPFKKGALPGDYWLTVTEAATSLTDERRDISVRRTDAPLPSSAAQTLHQLWLAVLKQSRINKAATPCAPTGVFYVTTKNGARLSAVTVSLDQDSFCVSLMNVGESLVDYAKLPQSKRQQAAAEIEKQARRLLQRRK
jgi:hypothetical protein